RDPWERMAYRGEMHQLVSTPAGPPLVASLIRSLAARVREQARAGAPDVLHVHWWVPGAIAARLAAVDVPTVVTVHGTDVALIEARPRLAALARWALGGADRVEAVSSDLAERLERAVGIRADAVNPMPLDPSWLRPAAVVPRAPDGVARVLAVGRMVPEKGFADLIAAVARLKQPVVLELIGDGPEFDRLLALADELRVALELPGRVAPAGLRAAYARADVVAQPSHREGLGLVAAEAVLAGTPVVAADSGGVRDVLPEDRLVPAGDVGALAERLGRALANLPAEREATAALAAGIAQRLSPQASAERTLAGYEALMERP
ncbi:MAG TPA: glycosyltransferase, partial [Egibacteraceae bacterium]|nr:glycosyltransferase [Egibacteraceae bacterium]